MITCNGTAYKMEASLTIYFSATNALEPIDSIYNNIWSSTLWKRFGSYTFRILCDYDCNITPQGSTPMDEPGPALTAGPGPLPMVDTVYLLDVEIISNREKHFILKC